MRAGVSEHSLLAAYESAMLMKAGLNCQWYGQLVVHCYFLGRYHQLGISQAHMPKPFTVHWWVHPDCL